MQPVFQAAGDFFAGCESAGFLFGLVAGTLLVYSILGAFRGVKRARRGAASRAFDAPTGRGAIRTGFGISLGRTPVAWLAPFWLVAVLALLTANIHFRIMLFD